MPRPKKDPADARSFTVEVDGKKKVVSAASVRCNLTVAEKRDVQKQAKAAGLSEAEFVRRRVLGYSVPAARSLTDAGMINEVNRVGWELNRIGQNVDQLLLATHRGRESDYAASWREIQAGVKQAAETAETVLLGIVNDGA